MSSILIEYPKQLCRFSKCGHCGGLQYLKGRLDELFKALSVITNIDRKRRIDQRIEKYLNKLRKVDEVAFHLYQVELSNRQRSKEKSKNEIKDLLEQVLINENIMDKDIIERIKKQIDRY